MKKYHIFTIIAVAVAILVSAIPVGAVSPYFGSTSNAGDFHQPQSYNGGGVSFVFVYDSTEVHSYTTTPPLIDYRSNVEIRYDPVNGYEAINYINEGFDAYLDNGDGTVARAFAPTKGLVQAHAYVVNGAAFVSYAQFYTQQITINNASPIISIWGRIDDYAHIGETRNISVKFGTSSSGNIGITCSLVYLDGSTQDVTINTSFVNTVDFWSLIREAATQPEYKVTDCTYYIEFSEFPSALGSYVIYVTDCVRYCALGTTDTTVNVGTLTSEVVFDTISSDIVATNNYNQGNEDGYSNGYSNGYNAGYSEGSSGNIPDFTTWIGTAVGGFMNFPIFGNFTIGGMLSVVLGMSLVMLFLKFFAGG